MLAEAYRDYTRELAQTLGADEEVIGLIALGSMATETYRDMWSFRESPQLAIRVLDLAERWLSEALPDYLHQAVVELREHVEANSGGS